MHTISVRFLAPDMVAETEVVSRMSDAEFMEVYLSGLWDGKKILSLEWTHKGETNKLVFGD